MNKHCTKCAIEKPTGEFYTDKRATDGRSSECKECASTRRKARRDIDPEKLRLKEREYGARHRAKGTYLAKQRRRDFYARVAALRHYGESCACCGSTRYQHLTIDHIDGSGGTQRLTLPSHNKIYGWLARHGFPEGFQTLCGSCNTSKAKGEHCRIKHTIRGECGLGWPSLGY